MVSNLALNEVFGVPSLHHIEDNRALALSESSSPVLSGLILFLTNGLAAAGHSVYLDRWHYLPIAGVVGPAVDVVAEGLTPGRDTGPGEALALEANGYRLDDHMHGAEAIRNPAGSGSGRAPDLALDLYLVIAGVTFIDPRDHEALLKPAGSSTFHILPVHSGHSRVIG